MSRDPRLPTNDMDGLAAAGHALYDSISAQLTFPRSARPVVGTSSTKCRSLPSSMWLALDVQAAPQRKGAAAEHPGVGKRLTLLRLNSTKNKFLFASELGETTCTQTVIVIAQEFFITCRLQI